MKEKTSWIGEWEIIIKDKHENVIERTGIKPNLIVDSGLDMFRDLLNGSIASGEIKYVALGSDTTAAAIAQTALITEEFRKAVTAQTAMPGVGELETVLYVTETEANTFMTEEIGWFAGASASATPGSGIMVARILYSRQKTDLETWTIVRVDTFGRG